MLRIKTRIMDFILDVLENKVRVYTINGDLVKEFNTFKIDENLVHTMVFNWFKANNIKVSFEEILHAFGKEVEKKKEPDIFQEARKIVSPKKYELSEEELEKMPYVPLYRVTDAKALDVPYEKFVNKKSLTTEYKVAIFDFVIERPKKIFPIPWKEYRSGIYGEWPIEIRHSMGFVNLILQFFAFNLDYEGRKNIETILPGTHLSFIAFDYNVPESYKENILYFVPKINRIIGKRPMIVVGYSQGKKELEKKEKEVESKVINMLSQFRKKYKMPYKVISVDIYSPESFDKIRSQIIRSIVLNYF